MLDTKRCTVCGRELPVRREYFYELNRRGKKGFRSKCRECLGYKFLPIEREGYQHCRKCEVEYPLTEEFFSKSNTTFTGFLRSCRECQREVSREWRANHPEQVKENERRRWTENTEREKARHKVYYYSHQKERIAASVAWCKANRARINARRKEKRELDPEGYRNDNKRYRLANREKRKETAKAYRLKNADALRESGREYRKKNRTILIAKKRTKRLNLTPEEREKVRAYQRKTQPRHNMQTAAYRSKKKGLITTLSREDWVQCKEYFKHQCAYCGKELKSFAKEHVIPVSKGGPLVRTNIVPSCKSCNSSKINNDMEPWYRTQPSFSESRLAKINKWIGFNPKTQTQQLSVF